jgi:hypothetical protein
MATNTIQIPKDASFQVTSADSLIYDGNIYRGIESITMGDGTVKTLQELLDEYGGATYQATDLKVCVKVEGYDPDQNNRQVFTAYSNNSVHVSKNETSVVPGGLWVEMFNFLGDETNNYILKMWDDYFDSIGKTSTDWYDTRWLGFRLNYGISDAHVYVMTWVNDLLEESQPCPPAEIGVTYMHYAKLYGRWQPLQPISDSLSRPHYFVPIREFKLYRSNATSAGTAVFQHVPISPISASPNYSAGLVIPYMARSNIIYGYEFHDTKKSEELLEPLPSVNWTPPPYRAMRGLTAWRNGMMAAYDRNTVMFCEPYRPFAWPTVYYKVLPFDVLALAVNENSLVAITSGDPFVFVGSHPANVQYERLENVQAGLPAATFNGHAQPTRAVTETPSGVMYASSEGPVVIAGARAQLIGRQLFTREEWQLRYKKGFAKMRLAYFDGQVLGYFPDSGGIAGFKMSLSDGGGQFVKYEPTTPPDADFVMPREDKLYLIKSSGGVSTIAQFQSEDEPRVAARYWTREISLPKPESLGAMEIRGFGGSVRVEVFTDANATDPLGSTWSTRAPMFDRTFSFAGVSSIMTKLPAGYKARTYSVRLTLAANTVVKEVLLASTAAELANG